MLSGNTNAGTKVYSNRTNKLWESNLPSIVIEDVQETASPRDSSAKQYIRKLSTKIEINVSGKTNYDVTLDDIAKQVEDIISANRSISGTAMTCLYLTTELNFAAADLTIGQAILTYEIHYIV